MFRAVFTGLLLALAAVPIAHLLRAEPPKPTCRAAYRTLSAPGDRFIYVGFRVCLPLD